MVFVITGCRKMRRNVRYLVACARLVACGGSLVVFGHLLVVCSHLLVVCGCLLVVCVSFVDGLWSFAGDLCWFLLVCVCFWLFVVVACFTKGVNDNKGPQTTTNQHKRSQTISKQPQTTSKRKQTTSKQPQTTKYFFRIPII